MKKIIFTSVKPGADRIYHINEDDIKIVLSRLPDEEYSRLRRVHFNDRGRGVHVLGYVTSARKEISMCAVAPRMSLTRFLVKGQSPRQFGAKRGTQWPELAIRRFLLYDIFLHELGHLQIIYDQAKDHNQKYANEKKAQEFADYWRKELWKKVFDHPDPVHNHPSRAELLALDET